MDSPLPLRLTARRCDRSGSILKASCSLYHAPYASNFKNHDSCHAIRRHSSLPSMHVRMDFTSSPKGNAGVVKRSGSTHSLRRSVAGMKSLLPLKLSASLPNSISSSSASTQRSTFGLEQGHGKHTVLQTSNHSPSRQFNVPSSITIRRERYRDIPVYTQPGSPSLNLAYYTDEAVCFNSSSPASSCNQSFEYDSEAGDSDNLDQETALRDQPRIMSRPSHSSGLSFQCLGETGSSLRTLNHDEGAWLSEPLNNWNHSEAERLPWILAESTPVEHDIEGWLSDTSSICVDDSYVRIVIFLSMTFTNLCRLAPLLLHLPEPPLSMSITAGSPSKFLPGPHHLLGPGQIHNAQVKNGTAGRLRKSVLMTRIGARTTS